MAFALYATHTLAADKKRARTGRIVQARTAAVTQRHTQIFEGHECISIHFERKGIGRRGISQERNRTRKDIQSGAKIRTREVGDSESSRRKIRERGAQTV